MVIATRKINIDGRPWQHWVMDWTHEIKMEYAQDRYRIQWPSGEDEDARLFVDEKQIQSGDWLQLALRANEMETTRPASDEPTISPRGYFVMWPFYDEQMTNADHRQLQNLPPKPSISRRIRNAFSHIKRNAPQREITA